MKKAIKVLNILTMIFSCISAMLCFFGPSAIMLIYMIIALIPLFVCYFANKKLEKATKESDLTGIAIVTLLLGNTISGILMLIIDDNKLNK